MPSVEVVVWILSGVLSIVSILVGVIWTMTRAEAKEQAEAIKRKADTERVIDVEKRWNEQLNHVRDSNEKLIDKLSAKHDRDIDMLSNRLGDQIRSTEKNILDQLRLLLEFNRTHQ